jgi:LysM repeat protein
MEIEYLPKEQKEEEKAMGFQDMKRLNDDKLSGVSGGAAAEPKRQKIGYNVKRGDNLTKIASMFGVSVLDLITWNDIRNPDLIYEGQLLVIYKS